MRPFDGPASDVREHDVPARVVHLSLTAPAVMAGPALLVSGFASSVEINDDGAEFGRRPLDLVVDLHGEHGEAAQACLAEVVAGGGNVTVTVDGLTGDDGLLGEATGRVRAHGREVYAGPVDLDL